MQSRYPHALHCQNNTMARKKLNPFSKMSALKIGQMKKWTENNAINAYVTINSWIFVAVRKIANFIIKMKWNEMKFKKNLIWSKVLVTSDKNIVELDTF